MRRLPLLMLSVLLAVMSLANAQALVRVLLDEVPGAVFDPGEGHAGQVDGGTPFHTALPLAWPLAAVGGQLLIDGRPVGRSLTLEPDSGFVSWNGRMYRGALQFTARDSQLLVINSLDLEDYLRGVVPSEIPASWPAEALRAQAVAARSYTLTNMRPDADYDICATDSCQVYRGVEVEHAGSDAAIAATRGLVLTYDGDFARTYYHSDSGGVVASSAEVWGTPLPYLPGGTDVAASTPHRQWTVTVTPARVAAGLAESGRSVGTVHSIAVLAYSESGRVLSLRVNGSQGATELSGTVATAFLRGLGLKSTRFAMTGALSMRGDGWGHGVGMSQYGAHSLAQSGYAYDQILAFYYPDTQLSRLTFLGDTP